jgi:hypothetical protein
MVRSGFWLIVLLLLATALNVWVLWLQMQLADHPPNEVLYGAAIVIELAIIVATVLAFSEIVRSHHKVRSQAAERIKAAGIDS